LRDDIRRESEMTKRPFVVMALAAGLVATAFAAPSSPAKSSDVTVGKFAVKVASALGYAVPDQEAAAQALRGRGVTVDTNLAAPLTEGSAARMMTDLGINVTTPKDPAATVSDSRAGVLAGTMSSLATLGFTPATTLPDQCLHSADKGTCVDCCIAAVGPLPDPGGGTRTAGKECGRFCQANVIPPISPGEPTP
jgi:hypothetical protein